MALSGYFSTSKYNGDIGLYFSWKGTQDVTTNTTTIRWDLYSSGGEAGDWWYAGPITVTIDGKSVYSRTSRFKLYGDTSFHKSGTVVINHNDDGTKTVAMSVKAAIYSASVNCTGSKKFTLDPIALNPYITRMYVYDPEAPSGEGEPTYTDEGIEDEVFVEFTNPTENTVHSRIRACWGDINLSTHDYWYSTGPNTIRISPHQTYNQTITFTDALRETFPFAVPGTPVLTNEIDLHFELAIRVDEPVQHWELVSEKVVKLKIIPDAHLTTAAVSYQDTNSAVSAITGGVIVQGLSTLEIYGGKNVSSPKGEEADVVRFDFNGYTFEGQAGDLPVRVVFANIEKPSFSGTFTATKTIITKRGHTATSTVDIPIVPWQPPSAEITLERVNGFETNTTLHVNGTISTVTGSTMSITERHKEKSAETWSTAQTIADDTDITLTLDNQKEWMVEVAVSDAFQTTTYSLTVGKGIPIAFIDVDKHSIGFNAFPTEDDGVYFGGGFKALIEKNTTIADCLEKAGGSSDVQSVTYERTVMINQLSISVRTSAAISSGANIWSGYLGDAISSHAPTALVYGSGYYNALNIGVVITDAGVLTIRNASPASIASGATFTVSIIWLSN